MSVDDSTRKKCAQRKFNSWTILKLNHIRKKKNSCSLCICDCGTIRDVRTTEVRTGLSKSCGCSPNAGNTKHGLSYIAMWNRWRRMIQRCHGTKKTVSKNYGGRGIKVCARWRNSFEAFVEDMGPPPSPKHSIDRFPNNNGDYEPGNCRWATASEQQSNKRKTLWFTINGEKKPLAEWLEITGMVRSMVEARLKRGWPIEKALSVSRQIGKPLGAKDGTKHFEVDAVQGEVMGLPTTTHKDEELSSLHPREPLGNTVGGVAQLVEQRTFKLSGEFDSPDN